VCRIIYGGFIKNSNVSDDDILKGNINDLYKCTDTIYTLDLNNITWKKLKSNGVHPSSRAGHYAVVLNERMYIWSGRCGYSLSEKMATNCLNDFWYLELDIPRPILNVELKNATKNTLQLEWEKIPNADCYLVEIRRAQPINKPPASLKIVDNSKLLTTSKSNLGSVKLISHNASTSVKAVKQKEKGNSIDCDDAEDKKEVS
jgi:hypothetical protein